MVKVLVPLDGSERSMHALEDGLGLLGKDVEVTLLGVQHKGFDRAGEDRVEEFEQDEEDEVFPTEESVQRMLERARRVCDAAGLPAETKARKGRVVDEILAEVDGHDLLMMHAFDRSGLREKLRLSALEKIARNAPCHVLLVSDRNAA